ncbi:aldehyde dehydrogenase family protein, partial [Nocardia gipuzkoensis]
YDIACARPAPIRFFGELGSINPVFVTVDAARGRAAEIAAGLLAAVSSSAGQLCTKPGLVAIPEGAPLFDEIAALVRTRPLSTGPMLNPEIAAAFADAVDRVRSHPAVRVFAGDGDGAAVVLATTARAVLARPDALLHEMFGPATLLVGYRDTAELLALARAVGGQLTVSIFADRADDT